MKKQTAKKTLFSLLGEQFIDFFSDECHRFQVNAGKLVQEDLIPDFEFENIGFWKNVSNEHFSNVESHPISNRNLKLIKGHLSCRIIR